VITPLNCLPATGVCRVVIDKDARQSKNPTFMRRFGLRSVLPVLLVGMLATRALALTSFSGRTFVQQLSSDGPQVIALADVDSDGLDDLLAVDRDGDRLIIFLNQGGGQFDGGTVLTTGAGPVAVATGDFNDDSELDIITVNSVDGTVSVFLADEEGGGFNQGARIDTNVGAALRGIAVADFNDDDIDDIAVLSSDSVYPMRSTENGSFARFAPASFRTRSSNASSFAIVAANIDAGSSPDLVISNRDDAQLVVFLGNGPGTFVFSEGGFLNVGAEATGVVVADVDRDNDNDIIAVDARAQLFDEVRLFLNQNRTSTFTGPESVTSGENPFAITTLDVDNDGRVDLAVTTRDNAPISILCQPSSICNLQFDGEQLEAGIWRQARFEPGLSMGQGQVAIVSGSLNDDSLDDIVAVGSDLRTIGVFLNTSTAGATPGPTQPGGTPTQTPTPTGPTATPTATSTPVPTATPTPIPTVPLGGCEVTLSGALPTAVDPIAFAVADFDLDGLRDLAVADRAGNRVIVYFGSLTGGGPNNSCSRLGLTRGPTIAGISAPVDLAVADFDRDSRPDLVVVGADGLTTLFGPGNRTSAFVIGPTLAAGTQPAQLAVQDFNRDGVPDVAVADAAGTNVTFFLGVPGRDNPFSGQGCAINLRKRANRIIAGDFNRDARADFAIASAQTNDISVFLRSTDVLTCGTIANAFSAIAPISLSGPPRGLRAGVFDLADAVPDLLVASMSPEGLGQLRPYLGQQLGTGVRYLSTALLNDGGNTLGGPIDIAVGDLNRDARADLVVLDADRSDNVVVYLGQGSGGFGAPLVPLSTLAGAPQTRSAQSLAVVDIDGDARDDIIVGHSDGVLALFLSGDPPATPTPANTSTATSTVPFMSPTPTNTPVPTITLTPTVTRRPTETPTLIPTATPRGVISLNGSGCHLAASGDSGAEGTWLLLGLAVMSALRKRKR